MYLGPIEVSSSTKVFLFKIYKNLFRFRVGQSRSVRPVIVASSIYSAPTLLPLPIVTAYSCFTESQPSAQLGDLRPVPALCMGGYAGAGGWGGERRDGLFALNVGPTANLAKLLGNSGFPGIRSPTGSYGALVLECTLPNEDDLNDFGRVSGEEESIETERPEELYGSKAGGWEGEAVALYARWRTDGEGVEKCCRGAVEIFNP